MVSDMNLTFDPNPDRTNPRDASRPWGRLTAKMNAGTSIIEAALWPDGAHILKIPARRTNLGAVVTVSQLAAFAQIVEAVAQWCADCDAAEAQHAGVAAKVAAIRASLGDVANDVMGVETYGPALTDLDVMGVES